jgi:hypothetical protein
MLNDQYREAVLSFPILLSVTTRTKENTFQVPALRAFVDSSQHPNCARCPGTHGSNWKSRYANQNRRPMDSRRKNHPITGNRSTFRSHKYVTQESVQLTVRKPIVLERVDGPLVMPEQALTRLPVDITRRQNLCLSSKSVN